MILNLQRSRAFLTPFIKFAANANESLGIAEKLSSLGLSKFPDDLKLYLKIDII